MPEPTPLPDHVLSIDIMVPRQQVWDEITKLGKLQRPLFYTILETSLKPGSRLRYCSPDRKRVYIVGEVVEVIPPRKFSHTYMFTMKPEPKTLVTWELEDIAGGCRVTLRHSGWTTSNRSHKSVGGGWRDILNLLKSELETGQIPLRSRILYRFMGMLTFMLPKTTKTEEVDRAGW
jgi:uncharacterized protein YndB with AHSA1/START domain